MSAIVRDLKPQLVGNDQGILGWLLPAEGDCLQELAVGKEVLELGTYLGWSTLHLASTARHVHTVDHHQGDKGTGYQETLSRCRQNLQAAEMASRVTLHVGRFDEVLPPLADASFDLIYVDGSHEEKDIRSDLAHALRLVRPGGTVALHDWPYTLVQKVCREVFEREPDGLCESLCWYKIPARPTQLAAAVLKRHVFLGIPHYGGMVPQALEGIIFATQAPRFTIQHSGGSLLGMVFNQLWCTALNTRAQQKWNVFAMHHSDIEAPMFWIDTLCEEMESRDLDLISCVVAIKDGRGLTSTGVRAESGNIRRLTFHEVHQLPETFGVEDVRALWRKLETPVGEEFLAEDSHLAVNTGLWVCRFDKEWVERFPGFNIADAVRQKEPGFWKSYVLPEDWNLSRWAHKEGLKLMATRKLPVWHHGHARYGNDHAWGEWLTDAGDG